MKKSSKRSSELGSALTEQEVREVIDQMLRVAFRSLSRDMEGHLKDIDTRLTTLETRKR